MNYTCCSFRTFWLVYFGDVMIERIFVQNFHRQHFSSPLLAFSLVVELSSAAKTVPFYTDLNHHLPRLKMDKATTTTKLSPAAKTVAFYKTTTCPTQTLIKLLQLQSFYHKHHYTQYTSYSYNDLVRS